MRQREETDRHASPSEARQAARKPYQKPAVRFERVFETSALVCGKVAAHSKDLRNKKDFMSEAAEFATRRSGLGAGEDPYSLLRPAFIPHSPVRGPQFPALDPRSGIFPRTQFPVPSPQPASCGL